METQVIRVAGIQMQVAPEARENLKHILAWLRWAADKGAQFCLFPEASLSGYHGNFDQSEVADGLDEIASLCQQCHITGLISTCMREDNKTHIQLRVYDGSGQFLGAHAKMVPTSGDRTFCVPGTELRLFTERGITFGCLICNDLWVTPGCGPYPDPRLTYQLGQLGAQAVFHAINSGAEQRYLPYHESNLALRALESGFPIITANAAMGTQAVNCGSGVMSAEGTWLMRADPVGEQAYLADLVIGQDIPIRRQP